MNMNKLYFLLFFLFITHAAIYSQTSIPPDSAKYFIGKKVTVTGIVDQVHLTDTGTYFLNMGGKFPDNTFTAVIFSSDSSEFSDIKKFEGKLVAVTDTVKDYKGSPEIIIKKRDQIKLIEIKTK
jgi:DNA/RNA endonuclease YhcR with UshA esterase domain